MSEARIWEEEVVIPTYEVGEADKNPMFLEKRVYQGSSGKVYPYPTTEKISREKTDKVYQAVFLENDYIKVMVLPELGGRIQRAYDKTNGYDFVYYNHVIKPALIGAIANYSACVGLAFQVIDDILDVTAETEVLGKTAGKDAANEKPTFVSHLGLEKAREMAHSQIEIALDSLVSIGASKEKTVRLEEIARYVLSRDH